MSTSTKLPQSFLLAGEVDVGHGVAIHAESFHVADDPDDGVPSIAPSPDVPAHGVLPGEVAVRQSLVDDRHWQVRWPYHSRR